MKREEIRKMWIADNGDGTYSNPILYTDYSDPDAIRVGLFFGGLQLLQRAGCAAAAFQRPGKLESDQLLHGEAALQRSQRLRQAHTRLRNLGTFHPFS